MKKILSIIILTALCSTNIFAWTVTISGPEHPVKGEKYDYKTVYTLDKINGNKELKKVEYHWAIGGEAITDKTTAKDNPTASVTMLDPGDMGHNHAVWPTGYVICTVTLYFKDGTKESSSDSIDLTLIP